jgi:hypothetical protein
MEYRVTWEIDLDASSFREAAEEALRIQRDPESTATVFTITREDGKTETVDLSTKKKTPPRPGGRNKENQV